MRIQNVNIFVKFRSILEIKTNVKIAIQKCLLKLIYIQFKFILNLINSEETEGNMIKINFSFYLLFVSSNINLNCNYKLINKYQKIFLYNNVLVLTKINYWYNKKIE